MGKFRLAHRRGKGKPSLVDVHVGRRVWLRRTLLGMNQTELSDVLGLTYQQVQRYERGTNRMGASRLYDIARVLGVSVAFFFEEMPVAVGRTWADYRDACDAYLRANPEKADATISR